MRFVSTAAALTAVMCLGPLAAPAWAESGEIRPDGKGGCAVAWSYDTGWASTTVYYNNHCDHAVKLRVSYKKKIGKVRLSKACYFEVQEKTKHKKKLDIITIRDIDGKEASEKC